METEVNYFIAATDLKKKIEKNEQMVLLDVRRLEEYDKIHVQGAEHIDMENLDPKRISQLKKISQNTPVYLICRSGVRSKIALDILLQQQIANIRTIEGGTLACEKIGVPVIRIEKKTSWREKVKIFFTKEH